MKYALLVALVVGCGRFGFDERGDASDSASDGLVGPTCTATKIEGFNFGAAGITDLGAAKVDLGYSIGGVHGSSSLWGVHLDEQLVPDTPAPYQTSPVSGFTGTYTKASLFFDGTNLDGALTIADGTMFIKTFATNMSGFSVAVQKPGEAGEPSVATANGNVTISTWFEDTVVRYVTLNPDGSPDATERIFTQNEPANVVWVSAGSSSSAVIAWELANGACGIGALGAGLGVSLRTLAPSCRKPYVHGGSDLVVAFEDSGTIQIASVITSTVPTIDVGIPVMFGMGSDVTVFRIGGNRWAAWRDSSRLHLSAVSAIADATIVNAPSGPPDAYAPAGPYLFAVWGADLWAITCP